MCGIAALVAPSGETAWGRVERALDLLAHRGPDGSGLLGLGPAGEPVAPGGHASVILGHRRLSVLDLSSSGHQPMVCPATGNVLVFNGEAYNFIELRRELAAMGCRFRSDSDTEVILEGYRVLGEGIFPKLNGMWAIALYDKAARRLILSRDRLGVKPLYWARRGGEIAVASEIPALVAALALEQRPNETTLFDFLVLGAADHTEETFYDGIAAVPAGALWSIAADGAIARGRFHSWPEAPASEDQKASDLRDMLIDSVLLRLRSDAPTVSLLSGGLDSPILAFVAAAHGRNAPRSRYRGAFTYGYTRGQSYEHDETHAAAAIAAAVMPGFPHTIRRADPVPTEDDLEALTDTLHEPSSTPSVLASLRLYRAIRDCGFKVALSAEGADELFGGYTRAYLPRLAADSLLKGNVLQAARLIGSPHADLALVANRLLWHLPAPLVGSMLRRMRPNVAVIAEPFWRRMQERFMDQCAERRLKLEDRLRRDIVATGLPQILRYGDRNSMRSGVELRTPYLDYRLVEFALRTPLRQKVGREGGKLILRRAFAGLLPDAVVWQAKTRGFGNAEQYLVNAIRFDRLWRSVPPWAADYIDLERLRRALAQPAIHPGIWWPVSALMWLSRLGAGERILRRAA